MVRSIAGVCTLLLAVLVLSITYGIPKTKEWAKENCTSIKKSWGEKLTPSIWGWIILGAFCAGVTITSSSFSLKNAPHAGIAVSLQQVLIIIFSLIGAYVIYKENNIRWQQWLGVAFGIVGVILVTSFSKNPSLDQVASD